MQSKHFLKSIASVCSCSILLTSGRTSFTDSEPEKKKLCILGCGIAGLTTAVYSAREGYDVVCIDAHDEVAQESSFLNGSLLCPSLTAPWANTTTLRYGLMSCFPRPFPIENKHVLHTTVLDWKAILFDLSFWRWIAYFIKSSVFDNDIFNGYNASYQLSMFSKECMELLYSDKDCISYVPGIAVGSLQVYADESKLRQSFDTACQVVTGSQYIPPSALRTVEPALPEKVGSGGAILSCSDSSGDIEMYCKALRIKAESLGVKFHMNSIVTVESLECMRQAEQTSNNTESSRIRYVNVSSTIPTVKHSSNGAMAGEDGSAVSEALCWREYADVFIVATGNSANDISEWAGDGVILWPMKGYALEVPISDEYLHGSKDTANPSIDARPVLRHLIADDTEKVYLAPLDNKRVRVSGIVDIGARSKSSCRSISVIDLPTTRHAADDVRDDRERALALLAKARGLLPDGYLVPSDSPHVRIRACYRPQTADDLPVVGVSGRYSNLYYNCGHGHLGWTRATGASRLLVDMIVRYDNESNQKMDRCSGILIPQTAETAHLPIVDCKMFSPSRFW